MKLPLGSYSPLAVLSILGLLLGLAPATLAQTEEDLSPPPSPDIFSDIPVLGEGCPIFPDRDPLYLPDERDEVRIQTNLALTLDQVIDCTLFNSPALEAAYAGLGVAQQRWFEARSAYYPDVELNLSAQIFEDGKFANAVNFGGGPTISYDVLTFGRRESSVRAAEANLRIAELAIGRVAETLQFQATIAYYSMQQANQTVQIRQAALTEAEEILNITQTLPLPPSSLEEFSNGGSTVTSLNLLPPDIDESQLLLDSIQRDYASEGAFASFSNPLDLARAELLLTNSQRELELAVRNQRIIHRRLALLLALEETEGVIAADTIQLASSWEAPLEDSIIMAYQNRPDLNQLLASRELNNQERRGRLAELMPLLTLSGGIGSADLSLPSFDADVNLASPTNAIFLDFSWRPFDLSGGIRARAAAERREMEQAESNFAGTRRDIRFQVEEAYFSLEAAANNIARAERAENRAFSALQSAQTGTGRAGQLDLLEAQTDYTDARLTYISTLMDYNRALASLEYAVGGLGLFPPLPTEFPNREYELFDVTPPDIEATNPQDEMPDVENETITDSTEDEAILLSEENLEMPFSNDSSALLLD